MDEGNPSVSFSSLPKQFGKYSILGHLATGGMAEVYVARQAGLQGFEKIVVIKRVRPELTDDVEATGFFLDEARLVATLEHPNIAQVYEIGLVKDSYFFVMEYVHGADLRQLLDTSARRRRPISLADAVYIMIHVCSALHYAHEKCDLDGEPLHIIHRDVSPSNVLLSHDGGIKVCDFGIAKAASRSTQTVRGVLKGKFSYMSPEQCQSHELDRRSDVFSLGILLFELSTLTKLFKGDSDFEVMRAIIEGTPPSPAARVSDYPPALERIVMRALEKNPDVRYPTAQAMQLDLEEFAREHKLAMSSVNIAKLMNASFEKRSQSWMNAQRAGKALEDHLLDTASRDSGDLPQFLPIGSNDSNDNDGDEVIEVTSVDTGKRATDSAMAAKRRTPLPMAAVQAPAPRRASLAWIVGAVVAGGIAGGIGFVNDMLIDAANRAAAVAVEADVDKLVATFDSAARSTHTRADSIATAPMLRAGIDTDAATMKDLAEHEYVFSLDKNEVAEVFQLGQAKPISMLRIPSTATALAPLASQDTRLYADGAGVRLSAGAPISGYKSRGVLVISVPVDLALVDKALAEHAVQATLLGLGTSELPLVAPSQVPPVGTAIRIQVPSSANWGVASLTVAAIPIAAAKLAWVKPVRYASSALGGLLLFGYLLARRRARADNDLLT